jgi:hypothetical protein
MLLDLISGTHLDADQLRSAEDIPSPENLPHVKFRAGATEATYDEMADTKARLSKGLTGAVL